MASVLVAVRDEATLTVGDVVEGWERLELVERLNAPGAWVLEAPADARNVGQLTLGAGVVVWDESGCMFSGPVTRVARERGAGDSAVRVTVSGHDDLWWLWQRVCQPVAAGAPYTGVEYYSLSGAAETVLRTLVREQAGPDAMAARQVVGLDSGVDWVRGLSVTLNGRWEQVGVLVAQVAREGGGFRVTVRHDPTTTERLLDVTAFVDRSAAVLFSDMLGNLEAWSYEASLPEANYLYVGGKTEGAAREVVEVEDTPTAYLGRYEQFLDARSTTDLAELATAGYGRLVEVAEPVTITAVTMPDAPYAFRRDFDLGDTVSVEVEGATFRLEVQEARSVWVPGQPRATAVAVGPAGASTLEVMPWVPAIRGLVRKVSKLEAR